jgi:hypothetical protein
MINDESNNQELIREILPLQTPTAGIHLSALSSTCDNEQAVQKDFEGGKGGRNCQIQSTYIFTYLCYMQLIVG